MSSMRRNPVTGFPEPYDDGYGRNLFVGLGGMSGGGDKTGGVSDPDVRDVSGSLPNVRDRTPLEFRQVSPFATSLRRPQQNNQQMFRRGPNMGIMNQDYAQRARQQNPFEGNEQYQALMDYQKTMRPNEDQRTQMQSLMDAMQPNQEQRDRMGELRTAFEGTGGFKDYRINQMEQQMNQMRNQRMYGGLGSQRPQGMGMFGGFPQVQQRPQGRDMFNGFPQQTAPRPQGIMGGYGRPQQNPYGEASQIARSMPQAPQFSGGYAQQSPQQQMPQPTYQPYQNPYQQQPQQYGGYGMGQSQGGFGGYGGMSNPYQQQQYGNQNNSMGYQQPQY